MKIEIDLKQITGDLSISEYVFLYIVNQKRGQVFIKHLGEIDFYSLEKRGYIKYDPIKSNVILRERGNRLFNLTAQTFDDFFRAYPEKTPSGRSLRTKDVGTIVYKNAARTWNRVFKGKPEEANRAIVALKSELAFRDNEGSLEYIVGIVKWLEEGHYQNTYDSKSSSTSNSNFGFDDMM